MGRFLHRPHGVKVSVNWADESKTIIELKNSINETLLTHQLAAYGNLVLTVTIWNNVSRKQIKIPVRLLIAHEGVDNISIITNQQQLFCSLLALSPSCGAR